jgi:major membrane immunogen (membrane-anchored lipoprotein)
MKSFLAFLFIVLIGLFEVASSPANSADAENSNEEFIQGTWRLTGENGGHAWFLEWTFDQGKFKLVGYPPLHQEGKYRVIKTEDNKWTLELYDQHGNFGTENSTIEVVPDKSKDTLMIKNQGPFTRVKAQT